MPVLEAQQRSAASPAHAGEVDPAQPETEGVFKPPHPALAQVGTSELIAPEFVVEIECEAWAGT